MEQVAITDDDGTKTITLSDKAQMFFPAGQNIKIDCQTSNGGIVYFESFKKVSITNSDVWEDYSCDDSNNENDGDKYKCNLVRKGNFNWNGIYKITFRDLPGNIIA